jgi:hypothetical protein
MGTGSGLAGSIANWAIIITTIGFIAFFIGWKIKKFIRKDEPRQVKQNEVIKPNYRIR